MAFWHRKAEDRALSYESSLAATMVGGAYVGEAPDARTATAIDTVYACVQAVVDASTLCAPQVFRGDPDGDSVRVRGGMLPSLLARPAPGVTGVQLVERMMASWCLFGEILLGKIRPTGPIEALEVLPPDRVTVGLDRGQPTFEYFSPTGEAFQDLTVRDILHVKGGLLTNDGLRGLSPIGACRERFSLANNLTTSASALFANGSLPSGVLTVQAGVGAQDQANSLKAQWEKRQAGPRNTGRIAVLTGEVSFKALSMSLADAQFIQNVHLSDQAICRLFNIPPSKLNIQSNDSMTYSNVTQENLAFWTQALAPRLRRIEEAITQDPDLCSQPSYVRFSFDELLRADMLTRSQIYSAALKDGWMTVDEIRQREQLPPQRRLQAVEGAA